MPCDHNFSLVKCMLYETDRVYIPTELAKLVVDYRSKQNVEVKMVETSKISDVKSWWINCQKKNDLSIKMSAKISLIAMSKCQCQSNRWRPKCK